MGRVNHYLNAESLRGFPAWETTMVGRLDRTLATLADLTRWWGDFAEAVGAGDQRLRPSSNLT